MSAIEEVQESHARRIEQINRQIKIANMVSGFALGSLITLIAYLVFL